jgi:N-acetylmuramoyl-L-alanine amidase
MRGLLVAAVLVLAAPGTAAGAGLSLSSRDLHTGAAFHVKRFQLVGLHWRGGGSVLFRTRSVNGRWTRWRAAAPGEDDLPDRGTEGLRGWRLGAPFWTGGSDAIQYRTVGRVTRVRAFFVRGSGGPSPRARTPQMTATPTIITRAEWGANEAIRRAPPRYADGVHFAIVHHTAGSNSYTASQSAAIVRAIELYHVQGNGWNDIGYNFLVDKYGQIFEGRYGGMTRPVIGAHAMGFNVGSVGVALLGDYSAATVTPAAKTALISLLAWRLDFAHVDPASRVVRVSSGNPRYPSGTAVTLWAISGHRDTYPTSCPGTSLYAQLPAIRSAVAGTGLPKIYEPVASGAFGGPIRFTARLSAASQWNVTVRDQNGAVVAGGTGTGTAVDWTWDSSSADPQQQYSWTIAAPNARSATGTVGNVLAPPAVQQLKIVPVVITPADRPKLSYRLTTPALVTATLVDSSGVTVTTLFRKVKRAGPQTFVWSGIVVPDGRYRLQLVAQDSRGRQAQAALNVTLDGTLAGFAPSASVFSRHVSLAFELNAPAHVQLRIVSAGATAATLLDADLGLGSQQVEWDGSGLPDGTYSAVLSVTDALTTVARSRLVRIDRVAPVLRLLSLRSLRFWLSEPARVTFVLNGRAQRLTLRRAGAFRIGHSGSVWTLTASAVDAAGNRSRVIRARR